MTSYLVSYIFDDVRADLVFSKGDVVLLSEVVALVSSLPHARKVPIFHGNGKGEQQCCFYSLDGI